MRTFSLPRTSVVAITALAIFMPLGLIFWQSMLNAPFFNPAHRYGFEAYAFIFEDPDFWSAFCNSIVMAAGMVLIALPLGAALAFLLTRALDMPVRRALYRRRGKIRIVSSPAGTRALALRTWT